MKAFICKQTECIVNLGIDFTNRLVPGEIIETLTVTGVTGVVVINSTTFEGAVALCSITIDNVTDQDVVLVFSIVGTQGSKRIGKRLISIQSLSD